MTEETHGKKSLNAKNFRHSKIILWSNIALGTQSYV